MRGFTSGLPDLRPVVAAVLLGFAADLLGLGHRDALLVALVVLVIGYLGVLAGRGDRYPWPAADLEATDGTRREMTRLTWTLIGRDGRVTEAAVRRLRADATRRLAGHGTALGEPRAAELLGPRVHAVLTAHGGLMPSLREIAQCVDAVEALGPARPAPRQAVPDAAAAGVPEAPLADPHPVAPPDHPTPSLERPLP